MARFGFDADTAVIGVTGLSAEGITMGRLEEIVETAAMMAAAKRTPVLADRSEFDVSAFARIVPLAGIAHLVTDAPPPREIGEALERAGVEVLVCGWWAHHPGHPLVPAKAGTQRETFGRRPNPTPPTVQRPLPSSIRSASGRHPALRSRLREEERRRAAHRVGS